MKRYIRSFRYWHIAPTKENCTNILYEEFVDDGILLEDYALDRSGNPINLNAVNFIITDIKDRNYLEVYFMATYPGEKPIQGVAYMNEDPSVGETLGFDGDMYKLDLDKWGWKERKY